MIEPELDSNWPELKQLDWLTAVVRVDSGLILSVKQTKYGFTVWGAGSSSSGNYTYHEAWQLITHYGWGARHMKAQLDNA